MSSDQLAALGFAAICVGLVLGFVIVIVLLFRVLIFVGMTWDLLSQRAHRVEWEIRQETSDDPRE